MAQSQQSSEDLYAKLTVEDEEKRGIIIGKNEIVESKQTYVLVGKFVTEKNINFNVMQNVMASL